MVVQYAGTVNLSVITLDQDSAKNHDISKWSLFLGYNQINRKVGQHMNNAQFYDRLYNASGIYCFLVLFYFIVITLISDFYILLMFKGLYEQKF